MSTENSDQPDVELVDFKMKKTNNFYHPEFPTARITLEGPDGREVNVEVSSPEPIDMSMLAGIARTAALEAWQDLNAVKTNNYLQGDPTSE